MKTVHITIEVSPADSWDQQILTLCGKNIRSLCFDEEDRIGVWFYVRGYKNTPGKNFCEVCTKHGALESFEEAYNNVRT